VFTTENTRSENKIWRYVSKRIIFCSTKKKIFQRKKLLEENNQSNSNNVSTSAFQKLLTNNFTPQAPYKFASQNLNNIQTEQQSNEIGPNTEKWISMSRGDSRKSKNNDELIKINEIRTPISLANLGINLKQSPLNSSSSTQCIQIIMCHYQEHTLDWILFIIL